ncbi:MAG: SurA N-terminal domain-containing protein [Bacteroidota bacterium]|nr:SurA N-terminal domain-containing protein [Bacteroidota bacterium]MDP4230867.1 SurA N-terminal domain-containing protein [Bacteroidota bacterium]MDP4236262.1 SurA N-terminal domain-containing protein [Bacteroidota bacterium]
MNVHFKYLLLSLLLVTQVTIAQTPEKKPRKKHKNSDTVGVVSGTVIHLYDFREQLAATIREHRSEVPDTVVSDTAYTRFVNMAWDKLVADIIIENELEKRKLTLTTEKTIDKIMKDIPKELKTTFTDSTGVFDEKALRAYLKNPKPDLQRTKILDYYQILFEQQRLAAAIAPMARTEEERMKRLGIWLKQKIAKATIDDRRTAFGYY